MQQLQSSSCLQILLRFSCDGSFRFIHWSEAGCLWPQLHSLREREWESKLNVRKAGLRLVWEIERITRSTHPLQNGNHLVVCVGDQNRQRAGVVFRPGSFPALNLLLTFSIRVDGERCNVTGEDWPSLSLVLSENRGAQKSPFYTSLQSTKPPPLRGTAKCLDGVWSNLSRDSGEDSSELIRTY